MTWIAAAGLVMTSITLQPGAQTSSTPVSFEKVTITDSFWAPRQKANATGTLRANFEQCEKTGRFENFVRAAKKEGKYEGLFFNDSDVYKAIEGACYVLLKTKDKELDAALDALIAKIAAAQQPDGYLNAYYTLTAPDKAWTDLGMMHELYCAGHLIEAGIAHHHATGKRSLLDVAIRFADLIDSRYGPPPKMNGICGHEEIEIALLRLWKETNDTRYRDLAEYFLRQRGRSQQVGAAPGEGHTRKLFGEYAQDHVPLEEQDHVVGHAVRAMYYYCAAADFAAMTGDQTFVPALEKAWTDLTGTKMYITGGIGNSATNEGFTSAYDLPNESAYAETCAGIGLTMWGHRMAMLHGVNGAKYMDVVERGLYNGVLSGVSQDGATFNYVNPLSSRGKHRRQDWFACACCPPNILRTVAQVGGMIYAQTSDSLIVNLYVGSRAEITVPASGGKQVPATIEQITSYPWNGDVQLKFTLPEPTTLNVLLRMPEWCRDASLSVNGEKTALNEKNGYASVRRTWKNGDTITWAMDMPVERMRSHPSIAGNVGRVALQRGPVVYCFEKVDNPDVAVRQAALPAGADIRVEQDPKLLGGVPVIRVQGLTSAGGDPTALYQPEATRDVTLTAVPYYAWDNRAPGEMMVWMPESLALADKPLDPTITATASHCWEKDSVQAMYDTLLPSSSGDHAIPRMTFWPRQGTTEWVQYTFNKPRAVGGVEVYWFDDKGGCMLPESWRVMYKKNDEWVEASSDAACGVLPDRFNTVRFNTVTTDAVRLEVKLRSGEKKASGGILEWRVMQ